MAKSDTKPYGLHIPAKGKTWVYNFQVDGKRHSRSTRQTRYSEALKVAAKAHSDASGGQTRTSSKRLPDMPLGQVFARFYNERASTLKSHDEILSKMGRLGEALGNDLPLSQLTLDDLLQYQTKRRKQVSNRTVNYEVVEVMRPVISHARKWGIDRGPLGELKDEDWRELKLPLPKPRVRSANRQEQAQLLWSLRKDYRPIIMFALLTGLRKNAMLIKRDQIDWDNLILVYNKKSKQVGDLGFLALTERTARLLRKEIERGGESEWVFTYKGVRDSRRHPITPAGLKSEMQRAVKAAGLKDWRLIHDLRHTAATETLRSSQNLAGVSHMLGHSNIAQTMRYAHVLIEDQRKVLETRRLR